MSSQYTTNYDGFQSTIGSAYGEGGPWTCGLYGGSRCSVETHQHIDSTATEYLTFSGTLGAMLKVRPELGRPGQKMTYTWQYSACLSGDSSVARGITTGVGVSSTASQLSLCPDVGQPKTENGEFTIANDGTFSIYLSLSSSQLTGYLTGMKFIMSPKEPSGNPGPAPTGESQGTSPSSTTPPQINSSPGSAVTANPVGSTSRAAGTAGASTNDSSTSSNIPSITLPSIDLPLTTGGSISQSIQGPVVNSSTGESRGGSAMTPIIIASILGVISAISLIIIVVLFFRQRSRNEKTIGPLDDEGDP